MQHFMLHQRRQRVIDTVTDRDGDADEDGGEEGRSRGQWVSVNGFGSALAAAECATHI